MIDITLVQLADAVEGRLAGDEAGGRLVTGVTIDTRELAPGDLFVPLRGEQVDGHDYVADAVGRDASGYLWEARRGQPPHPGGIVVSDPSVALLALGRWVRAEVAPDVVAVTGSNGKTTTKDLISAAVGATREVVANPGSYNNELGVPLTCCRLSATSEVLVSEVGARGVGHIARLMPLLRPDIAVVTTVGAAHLEMFGSLEGVARAKRELVEGLGPDGVAVLNADDGHVARMAEVAPGRVLTYGLSSAADWRAADVAVDELGRPAFTVRGSRVGLPLPGMHNVSNALAALAVADVLGVPLAAAAEALADAKVSRWRMELMRGAGGVTILNDAYNANPGSTAAALRTLSSMDVPGSRWAVLGYMAELGPGEQAGHEEMGRLCAELELDGVVVVGDRAAGVAAGARDAGFRGQLLLVDSPGEVLGRLRGQLGVGDAVLVKASRAVGLELVATQLAERAGVA